MRFGRSAIAITALAACVIATGCSGCSDDRRGRPKPSPASSATVAAPPKKPPARVIADFFTSLPSCDVDHRGLLIDAGTPALAGRLGWAGSIPEGFSDVEHDGSTWSRVMDRKFQLTFLLPSASPIFVSTRIEGYAARSVAVALDDQPLGTLQLGREQIRVASTGTTTLPVDPGLHTLGFRFYGRGGESDAFADIDWIRIGIPDESAATYGPPTLRDVAQAAASIGGVPHRSIAMRTPGAIRCALEIPPGSRLSTSVGVLGTGQGEAEIRVLRDGKKPELLRSVHLEGGERASWIDLDLPLDPFASGIVAIELRALDAPKGGRVLFGDPAIVAPAPQKAREERPPSRGVVLVVLSGVERGDLPPWSGAPPRGLDTIAELSQSAAVFQRHRAPTTVTSASIATLLTGLRPEAHGLTDAYARLPAATPTLAKALREAGVRAAMFTGVPHSFRAFGTADGWERFVEISPSSGEAATAPIDQATAWIAEVVKGSQDARFLAVVHARGAHPPWDVTPKELGAAPPLDYTGLVEPRLAAQVIAKMRRSKRANVVTEADRTRIRALAALGLAGQDKALGALIAMLKTTGAFEQVTLLITADVSSGTASMFASDMELKDPPLTLPLFARFSGGLGVGRRVIAPTEAIDVAATILAALKVNPAKPLPGRDLAKIIEGFDVPRAGPQIASLDLRYSTRWGELVLSGRFPAAPELCDLSLDPLCAFNRRDAMPISTQAIFRTMVIEQPIRAVPAVKREAATLDPDTFAALRVWGAVE